MASTPDPILALEEQGDGENDTTWGDKLNTVIGLLGEAMKSVTSIDCTGVTTLTLTSTNYVSNQSRRAGWKATGTPGGAMTILAPSKQWIGLVINALGGGFALTIKTATGAGVTIANGATALVWSDGTNFYDSGFGTASAATAALFQASSNTNSVAITGSGTVTLTLNETGRAFVAGVTTVKAVDGSNTANFVQGTVQAYSGTTLVIAVSSSGGSGTPANWVIGFAGTNTFVTTTVAAAGSEQFQLGMCGGA